MIRVNVPRCSYAMHGSGSDPWYDVSHKVSVDPVGDVIIHICYLKILWNFWEFGASNDIYHVSYAPDPVCVIDDHGHSRLNVEKDRICFFGRRDASFMINGHTSFQVGLDCLRAVRRVTAHEITLI